MDTLLLDENTRQALGGLVSNPAHAVVIQAPSGSGKGTIARQVIADILGVAVSKLADHAYVRLITPEKNVITIETVRGLLQFTQLKTIGSKPIRRAILLEDAHNLTTEAQNALLKLLEEPPSDTIIVLTAVTHGGLLPTILSRSQLLVVGVPSLQAAEEYFSPEYAVAVIRKAYALSGGAVGLMTALLKDDTTHPLVAAVETAKKLLTATQFERLAMVDQFKEREQAALLLQALERILHSLLAADAAKQSARLKKTHAAYERVITAEEQQTRLPNLKLLLSDVFLSL